MKENVTKWVNHIKTELKSIPKEVEELTEKQMDIQMMIGLNESDLKEGETTIMDLEIKQEELQE